MHGTCTNCPRHGLCDPGQNWPPILLYGLNMGPMLFCISPFSYVLTHPLLWNTSVLFLHSFLLSKVVDKTKITVKAKHCLTWWEREGGVEVQCYQNSLVYVCLPQLHVSPGTKTPLPLLHPEQDSVSMILLLGWSGHTHVHNVPRTFTYYETSIYEHAMSSCCTHSYYHTTYPFWGCHACRVHQVSMHKVSETRPAPAPSIIQGAAV